MNDKHNDNKCDFYMSSASLNVDIYDEAHLTSDEPYEHDIEFYLKWAEKTGGPVLELGCGTGRVSWEIAKSGFNVVGLDLSDSMLEKAEFKRANHPDDIQELAEFVKGDMADFNLEKNFGLIIVPFRSWQMIISPDNQRRSLQAMHRHLKKDGILIINLFDPRLDLCQPDGGDRQTETQKVKHPVTNNTVEIQIIERVNDTLAQTLTEMWRFTEKDKDGYVVREDDECMILRWTYRWEMRYLLELSGFTVLAEYSNFKSAPPAYGKEQIWVARKN